ncbi:MAG: UvrD-helicase domain-containing protein [Pleurocapsa sp. SU_5_0]|nr:UvrD-helicase domain-containing protein [Pleurocapsa sp. SU_5_0]
MSNLTPEQQVAAYAPCSVVITAGAGTGKTHMLAERYLYYLRERNLSPLEIVAVTFTEKAATELRSRIRTLVSQELPQRWDLLAELEAAQISTIHALAARVCQEHFQLINIPADFQVLDDLEGQVWLDDGLQQAIAQLSPEVFQLIPYSLLQDILLRLLDDPYTANQALHQGIQDWEELIVNARLQAVKTIVNDAVWQSMQEILKQHQGQAGDKLEIIRLSVLKAIVELENSENIEQAIATIQQVNLRVGSSKNWQDLKAVKSALTKLRELVKKVTSQGLLDLAIGEADEQLKLILPALSEAYQEVTDYLSRLKLQRKVLTFSDLELYALQALTHNSVQNYYHQRWQVFLVDEFQDTNPTQAQLLNSLTAKAELTVVGDIKQSIYGFRRADIRVFQQFRDRILDNNGKEVILSTSFRTHETLIHQFNQIFTPLLAEKHQDLHAFRSSESLQGSSVTDKYLDNYLQVLVIGDPLKPEGEEKPPKPNKANRQRVEAFSLAAKIKQILEGKTPVFDRHIRQTRPIEPKDIAILTRTWQPLEVYGEALAAIGIPVAPAGGGNLLATREAKDATALLRFLANPEDDIALVAVLRSPFFAVSDRLIFTIRASFATPKEQDTCWWDELPKFDLNMNKFSELSRPVKVLQQLLKSRESEMPSRVLQLADRLTGYTAVIANLAGAERRLADWRGFGQLVKDLEQGTYDLFGVVRRLKRLYQQEVAVPRPVVAVNNAVSLMTVYAAKGLEWGLVIVADLSKERPKSAPAIRFDAQLGVAVTSKNLLRETQKPVLYSWLEYLQEQQEREEAVRVLYVALTRARDYLILSAAEPYKGELNRLQRGLSAANIPTQTIPYTDAKALPPIPQMPPIPAHLPSLLINGVGSGLSELPVTALTDYARCPQRFKLHFIDGHPGLGEGILKDTASHMAYAMQTGTLVHKALEHNLTQPQDLLPFAEEDWSQSLLDEAIALAIRFFKLPIYQHLRQTAVAKEQQISFKLDRLTFNGVIDLVGHDWVLDYKSDRTIQPQDHRFQLWVYAAALNHPHAHIVYLRHDKIHSFMPSHLEEIADEANSLSQKISQGDYIATPTTEKCAYCPYLAFCNDATI